jgi:hypothetical protein
MLTEQEVGMAKTILDNWRDAVAEVTENMLSYRRFGQSGRSSKTDLATNLIYIQHEVEGKLAAAECARTHLRAARYLQALEADTDEIAEKTGLPRFLIDLLRLADMDDLRALVERLDDQLERTQHDYEMFVRGANQRGQELYVVPLNSAMAGLLTEAFEERAGQPSERVGNIEELIREILEKGDDE